MGNCGGLVIQPLAMGASLGYKSRGGKKHEKIEKNSG